MWRLINTHLAISVPLVVGEVIRMIRPHITCTGQRPCFHPQQTRPTGGIYWHPERISKLTTDSSTLLIYKTSLYSRVLSEASLPARSDVESPGRRANIKILMKKKFGEWAQQQAQYQPPRIGDSPSQSDSDSQADRSWWKRIGIHLC
jgi:hypothetical protein